MVSVEDGFILTELRFEEEWNRPEDGRRLLYRENALRGGPPLDWVDRDVFREFSEAFRSFEDRWLLGLLRPA